MTKEKTTNKGNSGMNWGGLSRIAEKYVALVLMASMSYLYLESQIEAKPVIQASVSVIAVLFLIRSQFKR